MYFWSVSPYHWHLQIVLRDEFWHLSTNSQFVGVGSELFTSPNISGFVHLLVIKACWAFCQQAYHEFYRVFCVQIFYRTYAVVTPCLLFKVWSLQAGPLCVTLFQLFSLFSSRILLRVSIFCHIGTYEYLLLTSIFWPYWVAANI